MEFYVCFDLAAIITDESLFFFRTKDASAEAVELGDRRAVELSTRLQRVYLRRTKEDTLADILPTKDERIIFCELSNLQKDLYKYIIEQPDFIVLRHKNAPCDCGVNMKVSHRNWYHSSGPYLTTGGLTLNVLVIVLLRVSAFAK